MPINTKYSGYEIEATKSTRVRDFDAGEIQVKSKGDTYLPMLTGQTKAEYNAYLQRGVLVPAVAPTVSAIIGAIMRKPPVIDTTLKGLVDSVDGTKKNINLFTSEAIRELLLSGGVGQLVEWSSETNSAVIKTYVKESLINYSSDYIVLKQSYTIRDPKDKFKESTKTEYLELTFDDEGYYIQNIWREDGKVWKIFQTFEPNKRGDRLTEIPFVFASIEGLGIKIKDPILLNLSSVNLSQYRLSADQRHGLHWTALPTMFLFGSVEDETGKKKQIKVGAGAFNQIDDTTGRVELLEFTGAGLGAVKLAIDDDIKTMANIGAKMLTSEQGGVKSAETARIEVSSETANLSTIANAIDLMMSELFRIIDEWSDTSNSTYAVNRDFVDIKLDPEALNAYLQAFLSGGMSLDTFLNLLFKGELLPKGITPEDEADRIDQGSAPFKDNSIDD